MNKDDKNKRAFPVKFSKDEKEEIINFALEQTNWNDAVRYLIEKEIYENGIRNLSKIIPKERDREYFEALFRDKVISQNYVNHEINISKVEVTEMKNKIDNEDPEPISSQDIKKKIEKAYDEVENIDIYEEYL